MANWHSFYKRPWSERLTILINNQNLTTEEQQLIQNSYDYIGAKQVENYIYNFGVQTDLLLQLPVNGREMIVPMTTEEPSVIAAANNGARMMRYGNGVKTKRQEHLMRGQVIIVNLSDIASLQG